MSKILGGLAAIVALAGCAAVAPMSGTGVAAAPRPPARAAFLSADLAGKDAAALDALLGAPELTRVEGEGEFRRYAFAECAVIVILYPDDQGVRRVMRIDAGALAADGSKPDLDFCLAAGRTRAG